MDDGNFIFKGRMIYTLDLFVNRIGSRLLSRSSIKIGQLRVWLLAVIVRLARLGHVSAVAHGDTQPHVVNVPLLLT